MKNNNLKSLHGKSPVIGRNCFIAETCTIIGDVEIGNNCSIWYGAILRGDVGSIKIGDDSNIQDGAIVHSTYDISNVDIGRRVSIAHGAIIHGCIIENDVLVGMGAIIMDNAVLHSQCMIAAGAVVPANMICESGWIYAGIPAKKMKKLDMSKMADFFAATPENYKKYSKWYLDEGYGKSL